jgi:purine-binding chemotaxis protein CheW
MEKQYVSFEISGNMYCVDVIDIKEVVREENITVLPNAPYFVEGLTNLRGIVIPVISIRKKLGLTGEVNNAEKEESGETAASQKTSKLIIVNIEGVLVAFSVDALDKVFTIDSGDIQSSEKVLDSTIDKALIQGFVKVDENLYLILDIKKMLDFDEKYFIQQEVI